MVKYEAIIFAFVYERRCVRWISVGGLCTRYLCFSPPYLHVCVWRMNEMFCVLVRMSDYRHREGQERVREKEMLENNE